jgi:hypothetical protein
MSAFQSDLTNLQDSITTALTSTNVKTNIPNINELESYFVSLGYYSQLQNENLFLTQDTSNNSTDLFTNNRKTYYENQYIESLSQWYKIWFAVYMCLLLIYVALSFFAITNDVRMVILKCVFLFVYPFITSYLSQLVLSILFILKTETLLNPYLNMVPSASKSSNLSPYLNTFSTPYNNTTVYIS